MSLEYGEGRFERVVAKSVAVVKKVLGEAREASSAKDVHHVYADKYALVEAQLSASVASTLQSLNAMGLGDAPLRAMMTWAAAGKSVSLRFNLSTDVRWVREWTREVEDATKHKVRASRQRRV